MWRCAVVALLVSAPLFDLAPGSASAEEFRVDSKVFLKDAKEPFAEITTLFRAGVVYDYVNDGEITVFDPVRQRFILLDPARKVKCEVLSKRIREFTREMSARIAKSEDEILRFMAAPKFNMTEQPDGRFTFASQWITYRVETIAPENTTALRQYEEFADWSAQLNPLTDPRALPPFPRLQVNRALREHGRLPVNVEVTLVRRSRLPGRKSETVIRSEHQATWQLRADDLKKIDEIGKLMATYKDVDLAAYCSRDVASANR